MLNFWRQLSRLRQAGLIGNPAPLERVLLDEQVWAFRVGGATTVANLSPEPVTRPFPSGEVSTVLAFDHGGTAGHEGGRRSRARALGGARR